MSQRATLSPGVVRRAQVIRADAGMFAIGDCPGVLEADGFGLASSSLQAAANPMPFEVVSRRRIVDGSMGRA